MARNRRPKPKPGAAQAAMDGAWWWINYLPGSGLLPGLGLDDVADIATRTAERLALLRSVPPPLGPELERLERMLVWAAKTFDPTRRCRRCGAWPGGAYEVCTWPSYGPDPFTAGNCEVTSRAQWEREARARAAAALEDERTRRLPFHVV